MKRTVQLLAIAGVSFFATNVSAQWINCANSSPTCTLQTVGVGNTVPVRNLVISGGGSATFQLSTRGSAPTATDGFQFQQVGASSHLINEESGVMAFWTAATQRMTITSTGFVGIGTTTPQVNLHTVGRGAFSTAADSVSAPALQAICNGSSVNCGGLEAYTVANGSSPVAGFGGWAVYGQATGTAGVGGRFMVNNTNGVAVWGDAQSPATIAGFFSGNVQVTGTLSKAGGSFKIDDPIDPDNKYLYHSFVESPDMMNIYNGNVILNAAGEAMVDMPAYFQALNQEFRYQLTSIGAPGPNLYVAEEITGNRFRIAGGRPGAKVSWQVTGIRHDPWANAHRIPVEEEKAQEEKGLLLHPVEYGRPEALGVNHRMIEASRSRRQEK